MVSMVLTETGKPVVKPGAATLATEHQLTGSVPLAEIERIKTAGAVVAVRHTLLPQESTYKAAKWRSSSFVSVATCPTTP